MPDATAARDAARAAMNRKHNLAVILEDVLIILDGEVGDPEGPDSAGWLRRAQVQLVQAATACDVLREAIGTTQAEVAKLTGEVPGA